MSDLPDGLTLYRRTPSFDETTVPAALTRDHATKPGTWARIVVERGRLLFELADGSGREELEAGGSVVVPPAARHKVTPLGTATFHVEFYRE